MSISNLVQEYNYNLPCSKVISFSPISPNVVVSGSLKLALNGNRSRWKSKPDIEYDLCRPLPDIGPSESSRFRSESDESWEAWPDAVRDWVRRWCSADEWREAGGEKSSS